MTSTGSPKTPLQNPTRTLKDTSTAGAEHPAAAAGAADGAKYTQAVEAEADSKAKSFQEGTEIEPATTDSSYFPDSEENDWLDLKLPEPPSGNPRGRSMKPVSGTPPPPPPPKDPPKSK